MLDRLASHSYRELHFGQTVPRGEYSSNVYKTVPRRAAPLHSPFVTMIGISALYPLLFGVFILALVWKRKRPTLSYPPGPKGYPILGNVLDLTMGAPIWEDITSLSTRHGTL